MSGATSRRSGRRALTVGLAAAALAVVPAAPAGADAGAGTATFGGCSPDELGHCIYGYMTTRVYPTLVGVVAVEFTCVVTGRPDPVSTAIHLCSFNGVDAVPVPATAPGPVVAQQGVAIVANGGSYVGCVGGSAYFAESILGPGVMTGAGCGSTLVVRTS